MGYRVPKDISIIGYGDVPFASVTDPPLCTIRAPYQKMVHEAAEALSKIIRGERLPRAQQIMPVELVLRDSAASLSR
jgi:DNA-binding LacI/PurR family transcriptional regulator